MIDLILESNKLKIKKMGLVLYFIYLPCHDPNYEVMKKNNSKSNQT